MIQDVAHHAYQAARAGDHGAALAAVAEVVAAGDDAIDTAVKAWMDRTILTTGMSVSNGVTVQVNMIADNSGTGKPEAIHELMREVAWAGRLFAAYLSRDDDLWCRLWAGVPDSQLTTYVHRLLTTMTKTALAYEEASDSADCCTWHTWLHGDPEATGARLAAAHLN